MSGVQIPVEAKFDSAEVDKTVRHLTEQMNKLGEAVAQANRVQFNPIGKATLSDIQKVAQQFDSLKKISGGLSQRLKATGQGGAGFFDIDWTKMYDDAGVRSRQMRKAFEYVAAGTGASFYSPPPPPSAPGGGGRPPAPPPPPPPAPPGPGAAWGGAGRNIVGAGLNAMGPAGGVANSALSAGLSGGAMAGLAGLAGGLVALGIGKAIGAVKEKIGAAQDEYVGYDTLKRVVGDVNVGFVALKDSLRATSNSFDLTYQEGQKLGMEFAKIANVSGEGSKSLAQDVSVGAGFGRSFGMDPGQSNRFFATMRQFQVTSNDTDSRRLALLIGEGIAKSGAFAKSEEFLQSIASYTEQQTRMGMNPANAVGYAGFLSGAVKSGIPGLDVRGAGNMMSQVNSAISGGGSSEAAQNFLYSAVGKQLGLDPIQSRVLLQNGMFATGSQVFGEKSTFSKWAKQNGVTVPSGAASSDVPVLQLVMDAMKRQYGASPMMREIGLNAAQSLFGLNESQMMAFSMIKPMTMGGLEKRLKRLGIEPKNVNQTGISGMAQVEADSSKTDTEKDKLIREIARNGQENTVGSDTRASKVSLENIAQDMASKLIPAINTMRDGILYIAGGGKKGPMEVQRAMMQAASDEKKVSIGKDYDERIAAARLSMRKADDAHKTALDEFRDKGSSMSPEQQATERKRLAGLLAERDKAKQNIANVEKDRGTALNAEDANLRQQISGLERGNSDGAALFDALLKQESGGQHTDKDGNLITSAAGARGISQVMPKTGTDPGYGVTPLQNQSEAEYRRFGSDYLNAMLRKYGGDRQKALAAYNAGPGAVDKAIAKGGANWMNYLPSETQKYVPSVLTNFNGTPLPAGGAAAPGTGQDVKVTVDGTFSLTGQNGQPASAPVQINKRVGAPAAFGAN